MCAICGRPVDWFEWRDDRPRGPPTAIKASNRNFLPKPFHLFTFSRHPSRCEPSFHMVRLATKRSVAKLLGRPGSNRGGAPVDCDGVDQGAAPKNRRRCSWSWVATPSWVAKAFGHVLESHKALFRKPL
jgi:hypothetical protein